MDQMSDFLLTNEAARVLEVAPSTVLHDERTGQLSAQRTERGVRIFKRSDVEQFKVEREIKLAAKAVQS